MNPNEKLDALIKRYRLGIHFSDRRHMAGKKWIAIFARGVCLAEFFGINEALAWFPPN